MEENASKLIEEISQSDWEKTPESVKRLVANGVCHNLRVMAVETSETVLLPQVWWDKLTRRQ